VTVPNITWGDAATTAEQFDVWRAALASRKLPSRSSPRTAFRTWQLPSDRIDALFIGGSDDFRTAHAPALTAAARRRNTWAHPGRVISRTKWWDKKPRRDLPCARKQPIRPQHLNGDPK
jgi:hypothetical protein